MEAPQRRGLTPAQLLAATLDDPLRVAITGASGWFGATALDLFLDAWGQRAEQFVVGYAGTAREITLPSGRCVRVRALPDLSSDPAPQVLLHFAYLTRDRVADLGTAEYVARNVQLTAQVLDAIRRHRPELVVTASSGAVHDADGSLAHDLATNPYGTLKARDEADFAEAAQAAGAGWAIPRVFSVAGPGMTKPEKYALGSMIAMAQAGGPIRIRADRPVYRSYCGVDEVIACSLWAARNRPGIFETGGHVVEMADLSRVVAHEVGSDCEIIRPDFDPHAEPDYYVGDPAEYQKLVERAGLTSLSLEHLIRKTAGLAVG